MIVAKLAGVGFGALMTAAIAAVLFWPRDADASIARDEGEIPMGELLPENNESGADYENLDEWGMPIEGVNMDDFDTTSNEAKLAAFLHMIISCEHRYPMDVVNGAAYSMFYGSVPFSDMSDHPVITREMRPVQLPASMCVAAGYSDGVCYTTAAGAYQIIKPTWNRVRKAGSWGPELPDFSNESQDEAARRLLSECGALPLIYEGDIEGAIRKASKLWASLPGSTAKQGPKSMAFALARFTEGMA